MIKNIIKACFWVGLIISLGPATANAEQTHTIRIAGSSFMPATNSSSLTFTKSNSGSISTLNGYDYFATLPVPDGATLKYVTFFFKDSDYGSDSWLRIFKQNNQGEVTELETIESGTEDTVAHSKKSKLINEKIDYSQYSYSIVWDPAASGSVTDPQIFYGVEVEFTAPANVVVVPLF